MKIKTDVTIETAIKSAVKDEMERRSKQSKSS